MTADEDSTQSLDEIVDGQGPWLAADGPQEDVDDYKDRAKAHRQASVAMLHDANRDRLDDIFIDDFHPDDPPESYQQLQNEIAVRNLAWTVKSAVGGVTIYTSTEDGGDHRYHRNNASNRIGSGRQPVERIAETEEQEYGKQEEKLAEKAIEQMGTYGDIAEPHLAELGTSPRLDTKFKQAALDELQELREDKQEPNSLTEAIVGWLS